MIQVILLICGIFVALRLSKLKRRTASDYPGVDPEKFSLWHEADLKSAKAFLIATWGALLVQLVTILAIALFSQYRALTLEEAIGGRVVILAEFLVPLVWAASLGSKARHLKREAGIK